MMLAYLSQLQHREMRPPLAVVGEAEDVVAPGRHDPEHPLLAPAADADRQGLAAADSEEAEVEVGPAGGGEAANPGAGVFVCAPPLEKRIAPAVFDNPPPAEMGEIEELVIHV